MTWWFPGRAAGMVALVALSLATALGALATRRGRPDDRVVRQVVHRAAAVSGLALLVLHVALMVTDAYVDVSVPGVLVPFTAGYRGFALGLGTLAAYVLVVVAVTGAARGRLADRTAVVRRWRGVHAAAYAAWVLSMLHGVLAGTDTGAWWSTATYVACGAGVLAAAALRLRDRSADAHRPLTAARRRITHDVSGRTA